MSKTNATTKPKYLHIPEGKCGNTYLYETEGKEFFIKSPKEAHFDSGLVMPETEVARMTKDEYAGLAIMNLLGIKTPTEMALAKWPDGGCIIIKRKIGDGQGEKNQIQASYDSAHIDLDQITRTRVVAHILCAADLHIGTDSLHNAFDVGRGKHAVYDLSILMDSVYDNKQYDRPKIREELSSSFPLSHKEDDSCKILRKSGEILASSTFEMNETQSLFYLPFRSITGIGLMEMRVMLKLPRMGGEYLTNIN